MLPWKILIPILSIAVILLAVRLWMQLRKTPLDPAVPTEPLSPDESEAFRDWLAQTALPAAVLRALPDRTVRPEYSTLGGPAFLPAGTAWPLDREGVPMQHLARICFAEFPWLEDFPDEGSLHFFISINPLLALGEDDELRGDTRVIYIGPEEEADLSPLHPPETTGASHEHYADFPFQDSKTAREGCCLDFERAEVIAPISDWRVTDWREGRFDRCDWGQLEAFWPESTEPPGPHYVGGQADFVQCDPREEIEAWRAFDRCLLKLGVDDRVMFGDAGEANFMIRRDDLLARRFERYWFTWDCG